MLAVRSQRKSALYDDVLGLPLYRSAPALDVRLEQFELFPIDRLRVLKGITDGLSRGKKHEEMEKLVSDISKANMRHPQASEVISKDIISHFVLRLVYCTTEDLKKWFLSMETTLFRYPFRNEKPEAQRSLMAEFGLLDKKVDSSELESIKDKFAQLARSMGRSIFSSLPTADAIFYKVPFEEVSDLVGGRRVFISKGHAYVAMSQVVSLVATHFCSHLSKALMLTNTSFFVIQNSEIELSACRTWKSTIVEQEKNRLTPIVEALSTSYLGPDYSQPKEFADISLRDIDEIAKSSFPLCMRHLFEKLREEHHLTHEGRMQLGLFLKCLKGFLMDYHEEETRRDGETGDLWKANMSHPQASEVNKDIISHFVLHLVYFRTEDLRKWFLSMEITLFCYRFHNEKPEARSLMAEFGLLYNKVDSSELESVEDKLAQVACMA